MKLSLSGLMSDGSIAPASVLRQAIWSVSDPTVISVSNGIVTPLKRGVSTLIANINGVTTSLVVRVQESDLDTGVIWQELDVFKWDDLKTRSWTNVSTTLY